MLNKHLLQLASVVALLIITSTGYSQNVGIGQSAPISKLDIKGNLVVGASYSGTAAPVNGAIIQGNVGIGTTLPSALLTIGTSAPVTVDNSGNVKISSLSSGNIVMTGTGGLLETVGAPSVSNTYLQWNGATFIWATAAASLASLNPGTGLTGSAYNGGTGQTWSVSYGSTLGTAVQGNTQITINTSTGLSGGNTITLGSGGTITLANTGVLSIGVSSPLASTGGTSPTLSLGTVGVANGGTGLTSFTAGSIFDASSSSAVGQINDVTAGSYLRSAGTGVVPVWSTLTLPNAATTGDILYATGTNAIGNLSDVATGDVLISGGVGAVPSYGKVSLTSAVSGTLPVANGGTGLSSVGGNGTVLEVVSGAPAWTTLSASAISGWALTGNSGTTPATDYAGTSDANDFVLAADGNEAMRLSESTGNVVIGSGDGSGSAAGGILRAPYTSGGNRTGADFTIAAGAPTGKGGSGNIIFQELAPNEGSPGNTSDLSIMAEVMRITNTGALSFGSTGTATGSANNVLISGGSTTNPSWGQVGLTTSVTGTLPVANGGTGLSTTTTNGQLLIGNSSGGYTLGTLTAGTGISVTDASGSITVANTGVTSVGLTMPTGFTIANSPITTSGTIGVTYTGGNGILYAASGAVAPITIGTGLSFSGGTLTASGSGGTVTSVATSFGLTGGTITSTGTLQADTLRHAKIGLPTIYYVDSNIIANKTGGTVTNFSAGTLSPVFTTSVTTSTSTPALSFTLSNTTIGSSIFGDSTGTVGKPYYFRNLSVKNFNNGTSASSTTFLRGDGTWATPAGTGVTSVGLTMPTGFTVASSPVTTSGTIGVTYTGGNGILYASSGAIAPITIGSGLSFSGGTLTASGSGGTVTSVSSGNLSPLFTTSVTTPTAAAAISYSLTNAGAETVFGNNSGTSAAPAYFSPTLASALFANQGTTTTVLHGNASGNPSWTQVALTTDVTGTLPVGNGGTGLASYTTGSLLDASGTATIGQINDVTAGSYLRSAGAGVAPVWSTMTLPNAATTGDILYATGANAIGNLSDVATGDVLISGGVGAVPSYGKVSLTSAVSGTLPVANGGTGLTSTTTDGQLLIGNSSGGYTLSTLTAGTGINITNASGSVTIAATNNGTVTSVTASSPLSSSGGITPNITLGTVPVADGGTGLTSSTTDGDLLIGNSSGGYTLGTLTAGTGITITNASGAITITNSGGSSSGWALTGNASTAPGTDFVGTTDAHDLLFKSDGTEDMRLSESTGNVVIGSGDSTGTVGSNILRGPNAIGSNKTGGSLTINPGNGTGTGGSGNIIFNAALPGSSGTTVNTMAEAMRIDSAGNVGFGGEHPAAQVDINGDLAIRNEVITVTSGSNYTLNPTGYSFIELSSTGSFNLTEIQPGVNGKILLIWAPNSMDVSTGGSSNIKFYTGNPTNMITLIYSSSASEWIVTSSQ